MGHGWRNYLVVAFKDLRGIEQVWGLDKHFPILGKRCVSESPVRISSSRAWQKGRDMKPRHSGDEVDFGAHEDEGHFRSKRVVPKREMSVEFHSSEDEGGPTG